MSNTTVQVLIVEDRRADFLLTQSELSKVTRPRHECTLAENFDQALELLESDRFDVCLVDQDLGGVGGVDLIVQARERNVLTPMIVLTGVGSRELDFASMHAGAADFLHKNEATAAALERSIRYAIQNELDRRKLESVNQQLRQEIHRTLELQSQLISASRQAGMAEVASGVLHNVGNAMNRISVSAGLMIEKCVSIAKPCDTLDRVEVELNRALNDETESADSSSQSEGLIRLLAAIRRGLATVQEEMTGELDVVRSQVETVNRILQAQEVYAKAEILPESVEFAALIDHAIDAALAAVPAHDVQVVREYEDQPVGISSSSRIMSIVTNLISNAVYAVSSADRANPQVRVSLREHDESVRIVVVDNGVGIELQDLNRIFSQGYSTRSNGLGVGLHASILAARELNGSLTAESRGPGRGAEFILEIPLQPAWDVSDQEALETAASRG